MICIERRIILSEYCALVLNQIDVVCHGTTPVANDIDGRDPYEEPKKRGIFVVVDSENALTTEKLVQRIVSRRLQVNTQPNIVFKIRPFFPNIHSKLKFYLRLIQQPTLTVGGRVPIKKKVILIFGLLITMQGTSHFAMYVNIRKLT